ncbi:hypothetical protein N8692_03775 [Flavobacteriales bacterium]|nr:hypothetical protein [Flavobacteriales bacterium]
MKIIIIIQLIFLPLIFSGQESSFSFNTSYGKLLNDMTSNRISLSVNNLFINRIGGYVLFENSKNDAETLFGLKIKLQNQFFLNLGYNLLDIEKSFWYGPRKEIGLSYHLKEMPLYINCNYSINIGPSISVGLLVYKFQHNIQNEITEFN